MLHYSKSQISSIRLIFMFVFAVFCIGMLLSGVLDQEPYPSIKMPSFAGAGGYKDGFINVEKLEPVFITTQGQELPVSKRELLKDFPASFHHTITRNFLYPLPDTSYLRPQPGSHSGFLAQWFPGFLAGSQGRTEPHNVQSMYEWSSRRAHELFPNQDIQRVEYRWYKDKLAVQPKMHAVAHEPLGVLTVPIDQPLP